MTVTLSALWGALGAVMVQGLEFIRAVKQANGWPWRQEGGVRAGPYVAMALVSIAIAAVLAAASAETVNGRFGAAGVGAAAPLIIAGMTRREKSDGSG